MCFDGDSPEVFEEREIVARAEHACGECGETIARGERYERVKGLWDGSWSTLAFVRAAPAMIAERTRFYEEERRRHRIVSSMDSARGYVP